MRPYTPRVIRAALFVLLGIGFCAYWVVAQPTYEGSSGQGEWPHVITFSGLTLGLAISVPLFAQLVGGRIVLRGSIVVSAGATLSSAANVIEDGLKMEWAFYAFVLGTVIILIGLLALTVAIVTRESHRHYALVPAGTMAALLFFVPVGGPVMLATWLVAAALARAPTVERMRTA
jgi:hypothetical protein